MKPHKDPEGYKKLLVYRKAAEVQEHNLKLTDLFPRSLAWLKEQMDKSGRSGTKNIIEGWKRNTTAEYYTFLGYSIAAIEELKDDCFDIAKGLYKPLLGIIGLWKGSNGGNGNNGVEEKGNNGGKGTGDNGGNGSKGDNGIDPIPPFTPLSPLNPISQSNQPITPFSPLKLEQLRFYPLDSSLPPIIQLYLKSKEALMLLHKLQKSLEEKMSEDGTLPAKEKLKRWERQTKEEDEWLRKEVERIKAEKGNNGGNGIEEKGSKGNNGIGSGDKGDNGSKGDKGVEGKGSNGDNGNETEAGAENKAGHSP